MNNLPNNEVGHIVETESGRACLITEKMEDGGLYGICLGTGLKIGHLNDLELRGSSRWLLANIDKLCPQN